MNNKAIIILLAVSLCVSGCSQTIVTGIPGSTDALPEEMTQRRESVHETIETEMTAEETIGQRNGDTGDGVTKVVIATGWPEEKNDLTQVKAFLDMEDIRYMGTFNQSRERIDITLEDGSIMLFLSGRDSQCEENDYRLILAGNKFDKAGFCEVLEMDLMSVVIWSTD